MEDDFLNPLEEHFNAYKYIVELRDNQIAGTMFAQLQEFINAFDTFLGSFKHYKLQCTQQLEGWKALQKHLSIGPLCVQKQHCEELNILRNRFYTLHQMLRWAMESLSEYAKNYKVWQRQLHIQTLPYEQLIKLHDRCYWPECNSAHQHHCIWPFGCFQNSFFDQLNKISIDLLNKSLVILFQPPVILVKSNSTTKEPRVSHNRFDCGIEVLGANAWSGYHKTINFGGVKCFLHVFKEQTDLPEINPVHLFEDENAVNNSIFVPFCPDANFTVCHEEMSLVANFKAQSIIENLNQSADINHSAQKTRQNKKEIKRRKKDEIQCSRFCYKVDLNLSPDIGAKCWLLSLGFAALKAPSTKHKMNVLIERFFPAFKENEEYMVPGDMMLQVLELAFRKECTPKEDLNSDPRGFGMHSHQHLLFCLDTQNGQVPVKNLFKITVPNNQLEKTDRKLIPFYDWFFRAAESIRKGKHMFQLWQNDLVYGFCGKEMAENIFLSSPNRNMALIRFGDSFFQGEFRINFGKGHFVKYYPYELVEMENKSLAMELLYGKEYKAVEYIYNDTNQLVNRRNVLNELFGIHDKNNADESEEEEYEEEDDEDEDEEELEEEEEVVPMERDAVVITDRPQCSRIKWSLLEYTRNMMQGFSLSSNIKIGNQKKGGTQNRQKKK